MKDKPLFISRDGIITDEGYVQWIADIKQRFRQNQLKAAVRVNTAMLGFYWSVGRDLLAMRAEERWGAGVVKQFAFDMRQAFPNETGFSFSNVKYMKQWYSYYYEGFTKSHRLGGQLEMPEIFGCVPWKHHVHIISKCQSLDEALFYINRVAEEGWSRSWLEYQIAAKLYLSQGAAVTNFESTLPAEQSQLARELLKDEYNFEFLTMKAKYDEHDLEEALVTNITRFLLELGKGFAYVGRQMELRMDEETTFFPDLVFYHIPQKRYVIIELKAVKYMPEFAGKLNFYVTAADELLRGEGDNPSVGLVICKTAKKTVVEWSLKDINKPLGVASYQLEQVVARTVKELEQKKWISGMNWSDLDVESTKTK